MNNNNVFNNALQEQLKRRPKTIIENLLELQTTDELIKNIEDAKHIFEKLIVSGSLTVIVAEPNGGKTTVMMHIAEQLSLSGYEVIYINVDASGAQIKDFHNRSKKSGFVIIAPDLHADQSAETVKDQIKKLSESNEDISNNVFILDTLKKFSNLLNKSDAKDFMKILRRLTARGATIIALGHTNKYLDQNKNPIYEGVGDIKNDCDNLIYFIPQKQPDGSLIVSTSTENGKRRFEIKDISFKVDSNLDVEVLDSYLDLTEEIINQRNQERDAPIIEKIKETIGTNKYSQEDLLVLIKTKITRRECLRVLKAYPEFWDVSNGGRSKKIYRLK